MDNYILAEMLNYKEELASLDYIGIKIAEGAATREDYKKELEHKETLRQKIRECEERLKNPAETIQSNEIEVEIV